jgi:hypothetical protein
MLGSGPLSLSTKLVCRVRFSGGERLVEALLEDLDHCALHHGQAQLTRNVWEATHPDMPTAYEHWR